MYSTGLGNMLTILGLVNLIWVVGLTFLVLQNKTFLKKLFPSQGQDFKEKLDEVLKERRSLGHVQKMALKRYNPYKDTGGDQSFSVALLDGLGNGLVVTSLHSRSGTRVFAKPVKEGKEEKFEFSDEEKETVKEALCQN